MAATDSPVVPADQLLAFIETVAENNHIDAKAPLQWDGASKSAELAKDIAAFCNSRDGGVIVIGRREVSAGQFDYSGLSTAEAQSFDTTKVANWVNSRFSPPIPLTCHRVERAGKLFVAITIQEFPDIPVMCVKSFQDPSDPKRPILREGAIYIRNHNAESKPLQTVEEWRALIGLATRKQGDELLSRFSALLAGHTLAEQQPSANEQFANERQQVWTDLDLIPNDKEGGWWLSFHPGRYDSGRWPSLEQLSGIVRDHAVRIYDTFPISDRGTISMNWGIANQYYHTWAFTHSGLFAHHEHFYENREGWRSPYGYSVSDQPTLVGGKWLSISHHLHKLTEFFMFIARMCDVYDPQENVYYELVATALKGRHLVPTSTRMVFRNTVPDACGVKEYRWTKMATAEELRSGWEDHCAQALARFFSLFPERELTTATFRDWIERFKKRELL
jgi:hypothetical protein